jgi:hypothetical protein
MENITGDPNYVKLELARNTLYLALGGKHTARADRRRDIPDKVSGEKREGR